MKNTKNLLKDALKIHELENQLRHVYCEDENKTVEELEPKEIIGEAEHIYETLGWDLNEATEEDDQDDVKSWKSDRKKIEKLLKKYK